MRAQTTLIGTIARLQVQRSSLKVGQALYRRYDPAPLCEVPRIELSEAGVVGLVEGAEPIVDVHNQIHPESKNRGGSNGVSIGFTSHYRLMRERFGDHLADGLAGENILVETSMEFTRTNLPGSLLVETADGALVRLEHVVDAEPCVEFSRFALDLPDWVPTDRSVSEALAFLRHGMRGYYAAFHGERVRLAVGDRLYMGEAAE